MTGLLRAELHERTRTLMGCTVGAAATLLLIGGTYQAYGGTEGLSKLIDPKTMPRMVRAFAGSASSDIFRPRPYLAFGYTHPLFLVFLLAVPLALACNAVATDVETRRAELIYTGVVPRRVVQAQRVGAALLALVVLSAVAMAVGWAVSFLATDLAPARSTPAHVLPSVMSLLLFALGVAEVVAAASSSRSAALGRGAAVLALGYLMNLAALLWQPLTWLSRVTPFGWYRPVDAAAAVDLTGVVVLSVTGLVLLAASFVVLERRDLT